MPRPPRRIPPSEPGPAPYWSDLRFRHHASDPEAAAAAVARLVEAAEELGFDLELHKTRRHPPEEPLPD